MTLNQLAVTHLSSGYLLLLGNGQGWQLISTPRAEPEVDKLRRIMGLKPYEANGYPKIIFVRRGSKNPESEETTYWHNENFEKALRRLGWQTNDLTLLRFWSHNDVPDLICEMRHEEGDYEQTILSMRFSLFPIYQQTQMLGGLSLHAGLVARNGKGVLLAGPKNVGKSTCCSRIPKPWHSLCDEEALIVRNELEQYLAHPLPTWSDYLAKRSEPEWNVHKHVPISSIFFLEQADSDEAIHLGQGETAVFIYQLATQVCCRYWNNLGHNELRIRMKILFENATELARAIPAFRLRVSLKGRFWEEMEKVLQ